MMARAAAGVALGVLVLAACSSQGSSGTRGADQNDTADPALEDLSVLPGTYSRRLVDNIVKEDATHPEGFGVPDARVPYPDTYWPFLILDGSGAVIEADGIDYRWQGKTVLSPLEKFATVVFAGDPAKIQTAKQWEHDHHGPGLGDRQHRAVQDWEGHCPGWTGASMANAPILHAVFVKPDPAQGFVTCSPDEQTTGKNGCVRFDIGDINGLEAEVYVDGVQPLVGAGCFTKNPTTDEFDRIKRNPQRLSEENGRGCRGLNPGALLTILGNHMKRDKLPFAINAQHFGTTDQIWNQPAYRYTVNGYEEVDARKATELVATNGKGTPVPTSYLWNPAAKGFVVVDISISWVKEHVGASGRDEPASVFVSGKTNTRKHRIKAVIELDRDITQNAGARAQALIIGGEYLTDDAAARSNDADTFGPNRLIVPTFIWISVDAGREDLSVLDAEDGAFEHHNPFVKPSLVKRLIALGQR